MRWSGIHIEGFGKWSDYRLALGEGPTVIYGPNEAGKSTILGFARSMLYGFASKANKVERQEPLHGGKHGGRLYFRDAQGAMFVLERYASASGKITVKRLDEDGALARDDAAIVMNQAQWERQFLGGISERVYRELFAITLTELQAIGMLEGDELGKQLYHAGWSGGSAAALAEKQLTGQLDVLYRPKGSTQPLNRAAKAWEELEAELRRLADPIEAYHQLTRQIEEAANQLQDQEAELTALRTEAALLERAVAQHGLWLDKQTLLLEQEALPRVPLLPEELRHRHEALLDQRLKLMSELARLETSRDESKARLSLLAGDEFVLEYAESIEQLLLSARNIAAKRAERVEIAAELREHRQTISRLLSRISPDWTEDRLSSFRITVEDRDTLRSWRSRESELLREKESAEALLRNLSPELGQLRQQLEKWHREMDGHRVPNNGVELKPMSVEALQTTGRLYEEALREWELAEHGARQSGQHSTARPTSRLRPAGMFWSAAAVLGIACALLIWGGWRTPAAAAGAAAAASIAGALFWPRPATAIGRASRGEAAPDRLMAAGQRLHAAVIALVAEPVPFLAAFGIGMSAHQSDRAPGRRSRAAANEVLLRGENEAAAARAGSITDARESLRSAIEHRLTQLREADRLREKAEDGETRASRLQAQEQDARQRMRMIQQELNDLTSRRREWLATRGLPLTISADGALEMLDLAELGQDRLQLAARAANKYAELTSQISRFGLEVSELAYRCGLTGEVPAEEPETVIRQLHAVVQRQSAVSAEAQSLRVQLEGFEKRAAQLKAELAVQDAQITEWYAMAGAANALGFDNALETSERRRSLSASLIRLEAELGAGLAQEQLRQIEAWYAVSDAASLRHHSERTSQRLAELERGYRSLSERIGRLRQELETLVRHDEKRRLAEEREQTAAVVEELSQQYLVRAAALAMIRRTKRIMEEKRQPGVLREASRFMARLSLGRYTRIVIPDGGQTVHLHTPDNRIVDSVHVSRGTAEQVYLAMRLALADEASATAGLPMLLDDVFVNFDRARLSAAVEIVRELAGRRQLLLMTCHPHIKDLLLEAMPAAQLVELSS